MKANIDWSKAPEGTMGFHPQANGYVDHWIKWAENGDNWFCTCGFEAGGWVKYHVNLNSMSPRYRATIVVAPVEVSHTFDNKILDAWMEYANNFRQTIGVQSAQEAKLRSEISLQLFAAGFAAGVKSATVGK